MFKLEDLGPPRSYREKVAFGEWFEDLKHGLARKLRGVDDLGRTDEDVAEQERREEARRRREAGDERVRQVARKALGLSKDRAEQAEQAEQAELGKPGNVWLETTDPEQLALELDILEKKKLRELRERRWNQEMVEDLRRIYPQPEETTISKALSNPYVQGGIGVAGTAGLLYALNRATRD